MKNLAVCFVDRHGDVCLCTHRAQIHACIADVMNALNLKAHVDDIESLKIGIFGHIVSPDHQPQDGDRIELYQPVRITAQQARKRRENLHKKAIS